MVTELKTILIKKWYYYMGLIGVYLSPIQPVLIGVGVLITIDLVFGIMAARKEGQKISSRKLSQTLIKLFVYHLLIISGHIIEKTLIPFLPMVQIILMFLGITEMISLGENFSRITGMNFIGFIKKILNNKLKEFSDGAAVIKKNPEE